MNHVIDIFTNPFLITPISAFFLSGVVKVIVEWIINKKLVISRLFGDGGMPSSHTATVSALAFICGFVKGFGSVEFAIGMIFASIVCRDATGVRRETGKQAVILNEMIKIFKHSDTEKKLASVKLKEFVGHSPIQVIGGIIVGLADAIAMYFIFF